ncbi:YncE family protein [Gemmatimonadota bacterium]
MHTYQFRRLWFLLLFLFVAGCSNQPVEPAELELGMAAGRDYDPVAEIAIIGRISAPFISIVDLRSMKEEAQIHVPSISASGVAIAPNGRFAYVSNVAYYPTSPGDLHEIDLLTFSVARSALINPDYGICDIAFTPNGKHLFITTYRSHSVAVVDVKTLSVETFIPLTDDRDFVNGIAMGPGGQLVFVSSQGSGRVHVIDADELCVIAAIETGASSVNERDIVKCCVLSPIRRRSSPA